MNSDHSYQFGGTKKRSLDDLSSELHDDTELSFLRHPMMSKLQRHMSEHVSPFLAQPQSVAYQEVIVTELDGVEEVRN